MSQFVFNPLYSTLDRTGSGGGGTGFSEYATFADFPASAPDGTPALALDTKTIYIYDVGSTSWKAVATPGDALSVGTIDSGTPSANGLAINSSSALIAQSASGTNPGLVNNTTQTFSGQKTFSTGLTGTVTGHSTLDLPLAGGTMSGDILVSSDNTLNLGSASDAWMNIYAHHLQDGGNITAVDIDNRELTDSSGVVAFNWQSRMLFDPAGNSLIGLNNAGEIDFYQGLVMINSGQTGALRLFANPAMSGGYSLTFPAAQSSGTQVLTDDGGGNLSWTTPATGTVTSASVVSANGFAGTVATATTTPAITLSTTVTGVLQGNGTAISAAPTTGTGSVVLAASPTLTGTTTAGLIQGASTDYSIDPSVGFMYTGGVISVDWGDSVLYSQPLEASVDWQNRLLESATGVTQLNWSSSGVGLPQLTASTVPYLNASNILTSSAVTPTELGYVHGVTSSIQTQLNAKGAGTVTSVGFADTSTTPIYTITNSPITASGTIDATLNTQTANSVFAGPTTGSAAQPAFRTLVSADIPNNAANTSGTATNATNGATVAVSNSASYPIALFASSTNSDQPFNLASGITANPANSSVSATTFIGALSGNSSTTTKATNIASGTVGAVVYQSSANTTTFLTGNTTTTPEFLTSTGTGSLAQAPTYTGSTGTGNVVLATSPTLVTPVLGTPTSVTLTNATGLPLSTGVAGTLASSNVATATFTAPTTQVLPSGSGATYTTPTSPRTPLYIKIKMVGGGAGGGSSNPTVSGSSGAGSNGSSSLWKSSGGTTLLTAGGGTGGAGGANSGAGGPGTFTIGAGPIDAGSCIGNGGLVAGSALNSGASIYSPGGAGAGSPFFGGQIANSIYNTGVSATANTGAGGQGGGTNAGTSQVVGQGGGSGGCIYAIIASPASTYLYTIGGGGAGGTSTGGTVTGQAGGAGGSGYIVVEEYYS